MASRTEMLIKSPFSFKDNEISSHFYLHLHRREKKKKKTLGSHLPVSSTPFFPVSSTKVITGPAINIASFTLTESGNDTRV